MRHNNVQTLSWSEKSRAGEQNDWKPSDLTIKHDDADSNGTLFLHYIISLQDGIFFFHFWCLTKRNGSWTLKPYLTIHYYFPRLLFSSFFIISHQFLLSIKRNEMWNRTAGTTASVSISDVQNLWDTN